MLSPLREQLVNDVAFDIGQSEISAGVAVGQAFVIETRQMALRAGHSHSIVLGGLELMS